MWINKIELKDYVEAEVRVQVDRKIAQIKEAQDALSPETIFNLPRGYRITVKKAILGIMEHLGLEFQVTPEVPENVGIAKKGRK